MKYKILEDYISPPGFNIEYKNNRLEFYEYDNVFEIYCFIIINGYDKMTLNITEFERYNLSYYIKLFVLKYKEINK